MSALSLLLMIDWNIRREAISIVLCRSSVFLYDEKKFHILKYTPIIMHPPIANYLIWGQAMTIDDDPKCMYMNVFIHFIIDGLSFLWRNHYRLTWYIFKKEKDFFIINIRFLFILYSVNTYGTMYTEIKNLNLLNFSKKIILSFNCVVLLIYKKWCGRSKITQKRKFLH